MRIMNGDEETPLSTVRLCEMEIPPNGALDISKSSHLIIGYLLRNEYEHLESKSCSRLIKVRGSRLTLDICDIYRIGARDTY